MSNANTTEGTQVRKTISFSKKRDKDLIGLDEFEDDFSYNAKQLMRDGIRFRQLMKAQNVSLNQSNQVFYAENTVAIEEEMEQNQAIFEAKQEEIVEKEVKIEQKTTNLNDFLNSKTKKSEITEEDRKRIENNLDF